MTVSGILGVWNLFMTKRFIPVYTAPCLKQPALSKGAIDNKSGSFWVTAWRQAGGQS